MILPLYHGDRRQQTLWKRVRTRALEARVSALNDPLRAFAYALIGCSACCVVLFIPVLLFGWPSLDAGAQTATAGAGHPLRDLGTDGVEADEAREVAPGDGDGTADASERAAEAPAAVETHETVPASQSGAVNAPKRGGAQVERREAVKSAFVHAWRGYERYAFGHDEIRPTTNATNDSWGGFGAVLVDGLDTMMLMGLDKEVAKARGHVASLDFDQDYVASFFETTIRYVGGLLAAYDLSRDPIYLDKARALADRLLPAFDTPTGLPFHEVNLRTGAARNPSWNTGNSILSEVGSVQLEFKYLTHVTGDTRYADAAQRVMTMLYEASPASGLFPVYINADTGRFRDAHVSLGALADSFYEYLLKQWLQTDKKEPMFREMYDAAVDGIVKYLVHTTPNRGLTFVGEMDSMGNPVHVHDHLMCFVPGMLALGAAETDPADPGAETRAARDLELAKSLMRTYMTLYRDQPTGLGPEKLTFTVEPGLERDYRVTGTTYLLRPETIESLFVLYRLTGDPDYRDWAWEIFQSIEQYCRTPSAFSGLVDVTRTDGELNNSMQSFVMAETFKYLFLIFEDPSVLPLHQIVFNTEAHPLSRWSP